MKKSFLFACIAAAMCLSCTKETIAPKEDSSVKTVITVGIDQTKTTIGESESGKHKIYWANGDVLNVNGVSSDALSGIGEKQTSAEFVFSGVLDTPYKFLYPSAYYKADGTVTLPSTQDAAVADLPMYGYSETGFTSSLNVLTAALQISLKQGTDTDDIKYIQLSSDTQSLSGDFTIDYKTGSINSTAAPADSKIRLNANCALSSETAKTFVFSIPAGSYSLTVKVVDVKSHCMTKTLTGKTFTAGKYIILPELTFEPTTTEFDVHITTAAEWNKFAEDFNGGEYDDNPTVSVSIDNDIDFTDSEITTLTKSFNGVLDGGSHSFKNVKLTNVAIVSKLGPQGVIRNVKIDSDSKLTMNGTPSGTYFAPLVADLQGSLENCESAADFDFLASSTDNAYFIGGLAGRIRSGSIKDCKVSGTLKDAEVKELTTYSYIGGIAGDVNRYDKSSSDGSISGCEFSGKILMGKDAGTTGTGVTGITCSNTTGFRIGGIAGRSQNASVSDCSTTSDAVLDIRGDMLVVYIGGIIANAQTSVTGCTNAAAISLWSKNTDLSNGNAYVGGIAGSSNTEIKDCDNSGSLNMYAQHRSSYWGGIVGSNTGKVSGCTNSGAVTESTYRPRYLYFGGVMGKNENTDVTDVHNTAAVSIGVIPVNEDNGRAYCGGIIGWNTANLDESTIDNSGDVSVTITKTTYLQVAVGGVIGCNQASLSGATNTGKVQTTCSVAVTSSSFTALGGIIGAQTAGSAAATVSNCTNSYSDATKEAVYGYITSTTANTCLDWCEGGIIGYACDANVSITGCTNNAYVYHQANAANAYGRRSFSGGIVGRFSSLSNSSSITDCKNYGKLWSRNYNNAVTFDDGAPYGGGIAGYAEGASGKNVTISSCEVADAKGATATDVQLQAYRGILGGIAGYSSYATISSCTVSKQFNNNSNATYIGGMVGQAYNTTINEGTVSSNPINIGKNIGGIVSVLGTGSSITGSAFSGAITNATTTSGCYRGAIAATSVSGTTITNAVVTGSSVNGTSASNADSYVCGDSHCTISGTVCK